MLGNLIKHAGRAVGNVARSHAGKIGTGGAAIGKAAYDKMKKQEEGSHHAQPFNISYGDGEAVAISRRVEEQSANSSILEKAKKNLIGKLNTIKRVAHGDIPGLHAVIKGIQAAMELGQFAAAKDINGLEPAPILGAAIQDTAINSIENIKKTMEVTKNTAKAGAAYSTLTDEGKKALENAFDTKVRDELETAGINLIVSTAGAIVLDAATVLAPLPLKIVFKGGQVVWKASGGINMLEKFAQLGQETETGGLSNKAGTEVMAQIKDINKTKRDAVAQVIKDKIGRKQPDPVPVASTSGAAEPVAQSSLLLDTIKDLSIQNPQLFNKKSILSQIERVEIVEHLLTEEQRQLFLSDPAKFKESMDRALEAFLETFIEEEEEQEEEQED